MKALELLARQAAVLLVRLRRGGRGGAAWAMRLTTAAVASYVVAAMLFPDTEPLLAPLTALLVVQLTPISLLVSGLDRVASVVLGVSLAVGFSAVFPLEWWSLGVLIAVSILLGQALRLGSNLIEVPISAMLVMGVGSLGAESAGWQRVTETLVGAAVGVASNLLIPAKVVTRDAGAALEGLADDLSRLLNRAADEMAKLDSSGGELAALASDWLDEARTLNHGVPQVGRLLQQAEQGRRLNLRALGTPNAGPGLRHGMEALEHSAVAIRSMLRAVDDATNDPNWPTGDVGEALVTVVAELFRDLATGLAAFGELVAAEAQPPARGRQHELTTMQQALDGLHEAQARVDDLLLVNTGPVLAELNFALLSTVKRVLRELDLHQRVRRQLQLRPQPSPISRTARRMPGPR